MNKILVNSKPVRLRINGVLCNVGITGGAVIEPPTPVEPISEWKLSTLPYEQYWGPVAYGNNKFVVLPSNGNKAAYSNDGINWNLIELPVQQNWVALTYGDDRFVAVGFLAGDTSRIIYSQNGINWSISTGYFDSFNDIAYGNGKFIAVRGDGTFYYSYNGIQWSNGTFPISEYYSSIFYGKDKFIAISSNADALYSNDGTIWYISKLPDSDFWNKGVYGGEKFVIASDKNYFLYSFDGINWNKSVKNQETIYFHNVSYGNGRFISVALADDKFGYSSDGINWSLGNMPIYADWSNIAYGNGRFVSIPHILHGANAAYLLDNDEFNFYSTIGTAKIGTAKVE